MSRWSTSLLTVLAAGTLAASGAMAQLIPNTPIGDLGSGPIGGPVGDIGGAIGRTVGETTDTIQRPVTPQQVRTAAAPSLDRILNPEWVVRAPALTLSQLRQLRLQSLVEQNRATLDMDPAGNPVRRGLLMAIDPPPAALKAALRAGFAIAADETDGELKIRTVTLATPKGMKLKQALGVLRLAAPQIEVDYDHIYEPAGGALAASSVALAAASSASAGGGPRIGMIDGGVASSPALARAAIEQQGFAGAAAATGHGTAVASLIVGADGKFRGAAPNASLLVADVYGGNSSAGSASVIHRALSWLASERPSVINVSLVGPRNRLVEKAVAAVQARGIRIVAAVGNDGPAAPPLYPASQAGVIAVTGVDGQNKALAEAGLGTHLDYAGPGADMAAALPGAGYAKVRGTSFAAPLVTSRLAMTGSTARLDAEAGKGKGRVGRGVICGPCRIAPKVVKAK